jgi:hypothetical protein
MKCFIASAFGQKDVDRIYDRAIQPTLRELKIKALRVDRVVHNEDIDDKIFELLGAADMCIADLTYARPSVYYEAGYAFAANKPVVYIARSDHFEPQTGDAGGIRKIHFDLQMKNIIPWTDPNKKFKDELRRRVRHAIRPIENRHRTNESERLAQSQFAALPLNVRIDSILDKGRNLLRRRAYQRGRFEQALVHPYYGVQYDRLKSRIHQRVHLAAGRIISDSEFGRIRTVSLNSSAAELCLAEWGNAKEVQDLVVIATLGLFNTNRLARLLPHFSCVSDRVFQHATTGGSSDTPLIKTVVAIDAIKSTDDFAKRFLKMLEGLGFD